MEDLGRRQRVGGREGGRRAQHGGVRHHGGGGAHPRPAVDLTRPVLVGVGRGRGSVVAGVCDGFQRRHGCVAPPHIVIIRTCLPAVAASAYRRLRARSCRCFLLEVVW
jgi:hypothetical protein